MLLALLVSCGASAGPRLDATVDVKRACMGSRSSGWEERSEVIERAYDKLGDDVRQRVDEAVKLVYQMRAMPTTHAYYAEKLTSLLRVEASLRSDAAWEAVTRLHRAFTKEMVEWTRSHARFVARARAIRFVRLIVDEQLFGFEWEILDPVALSRESTEMIEEGRSVDLTEAVIDAAIVDAKK